MSNVFEFLGLPRDHRATGKVVQFVKNYEEVTEKRKKFPMLAQVKEDGVFSMIVVRGDGAAASFSRTGKRMTNTDRMVEDTLFEGTYPGVYIAELVNPELSLEELSGAINPNRVKPLPEELGNTIEQSSRYVFHDHLFLHEFTQGFSERSYSRRLLCLRSVGFLTTNSVVVLSYQDARNFADKTIEDGGEGIVLKQDLPWEAGKKDHRSMKIVREVSYDLECIGVEEGKGKYSGKVANLIFRWRDGQTIKAMLGKGWSHLDAQVMWEIREHRYNLLSPIGRIFEVYGLQDSSKGKIRLPKAGERRIDKETPDY